MKKLIAVLVIFAIFPSICLADWQSNWQGGYYTGAIIYGSSSVNVTEPMGQRKATNGPLSVIASNVYAAQANMVNGLTNFANSTIAQLNTSEIQASLSQPVSFSGPLTATIHGLTGNNSGTNQLILGGPTLVINVNVTGSKYGIINVSCPVSIIAKDVELSAAYDPITGGIDTNSKFTYANLNPTTNISCSSNLDFVPFLGNFLDQWAVGKINSKIQPYLSNAQQYFIKAILPYSNSSNLGIAAALTPGKYIINGVDWGSYIQNNFATLFSGQTVSISISMTPFSQPTTTYISAAEPKAVTLAIPTLSVTFSNTSSKLQFQITDTEYYAYTYYCPPWPARCTKPL